MGFKATPNSFKSPPLQVYNNMLCKGGQVKMVKLREKDNPQPPPWKRRLYLPTYTVKDSARYVDTNLGTVTYWHYGGGSLGPALPGKKYRKPLSYLQLVEVAFVATFRKLGVSLQNIRKTREYASQHLNAEYPFAQYLWKTEGTNLLLELGEVEKEPEYNNLIVGNKWGQTTWKPLVKERFKQFDYEENMALIWHVMGREYPIIIDPRIAFGAPNVKGIPTWVLRGRWDAGEALDEIKDDFKIDIKYIKNALDFEGIPAVAVS